MGACRERHVDPVVHDDRGRRFRGAAPRSGASRRRGAPASGMPAHGSARDRRRRRWRLRPARGAPPASRRAHGRAPPRAAGRSVTRQRVCRHAAGQLARPSPRRRGFVGQAVGPAAVRRTGRSSSPRAARTLTRPRPDTAPRTKLFVRTSRMAGMRLAEVIPVPERRPGNQDEEQTRFEQEGDEQQTSEQSDLPFGLEFRQTQDPIRDVAVSAGLGLELDEDRQRARIVARLLERLGKIVQQRAAGCRRSARALRTRARTSVRALSTSCRSRCSSASSEAASNRCRGEVAATSSA